MLFLYPILTFSAMYKYTDARQHRTLYAIVTFVYLLIVLFFDLFLQLPPIHVPSTSFILLERIQQRFLECNLPNGII